MKNTITSLSLAFALLLATACGQQDKPAAVAGTAQPEASSANYEKGKEIFLQNCASCHTVKVEMIGPPLAGAEQRWNDKKKLYDFIRDAQKVIETDKYAHDLYMKYNQTVMMPFPDLTDEDIDAIFTYVNKQAE